MKLPIVQIEEKNLARAWEKSVVDCWNKGIDVSTEYDKKGDPYSRDVSLFLSVENAFNEPRIHRAIPGGIEDLETYRQEVLYGIRDHWINPEEGKWQYTYHERMRKYSVPGIEDSFDQLKYVIESLSKTPHTRRAQIMVWKPWEDAGIEDPACLQRIWFRIFDDELVMSVHMRSNDAFKAAFMNMYAFTELQKFVADEVSKNVGRGIHSGQYNHIVDSYHIYGSYFDEFKGFLESIKKRSFEQRTYNTKDVQFIIDETAEKLKKQ